MSGTVAKERILEAAARVVGALDRLVLGQHAAAEALIVAYMAGGHALLEGVPGIGKTLLARSFAACLGLRFSRVQFTPDLMPTDIIGMNVFDSSSHTFRLVRGPVFTQVFMADEVNRTPPKTQSALLEAMQERQVTIDGVLHPLEAEFFVMATENPVEFEGTYPLPEAQLDRFILRIEMGLPDQAGEIDLYRQAASNQLRGWNSAPPPDPLVAPEEARALRAASHEAHVAPELLPYLARLAASVRQSPHVDLGVSPRGALSLLETARAGALLAGRDFVLPDDIKRFLRPCWGHRLILRAESELEGHTIGKVLDQAAASVEVPR
ncbi:MAG TPA: MoxR family ATPase [Vicinamibacteria bacterium]|jgi:MoxR-like ATPase|nr:MoxR family ATPase [Vicinamibacteria bacterium]